MTYDRTVLVDVLVFHWYSAGRGCGCGWNELGRSWPEHVATVYEESMAAHHDESPVRRWHVRCADGHERHKGHPFADETPKRVMDTWDRACRKGPHVVERATP